MKPGEAATDRRSHSPVTVEAPLRRFNCMGSILFAIHKYERGDEQSKKSSCRV